MKKELLFTLRKKDFVITYFSGTGAGGQHRNKHQNCVRIQHLESNSISTASDSKSRIQNFKNAFNRLCKSKKFMDWIKIKAARTSANIEQINKKVEELMNPENIKVEYY